jgi:histone H3/H4
MNDEGEGDRHQSNQQQPEQLLLLVEAIAEIVRQNSYQLRQTMQAVERLARVVEEMKQGEKPHR